LRKSLVTQKNMSEINVISLLFAASKSVSVPPVTLRYQQTMRWAQCRRRQLAACRRERLACAQRWNRGQCLMGLTRRRAW
jgi:hypothetical protein